MNAPSAYKMEQAFSALQSARARIEQGEDLFDEDTGEVIPFSDVERNAIDLLHSTLRAAVHAKNMADAATIRAGQISDRAARYRARAEALRGAAFAAMDVLGERRVELPDLTAALRNAPPSVRITDEAALHPAYWRIVPESRAPDKIAIAASLKQGIPVPGAELSNALPTLSITTR